jgi:hypothetical protein
MIMLVDPSRCRTIWREIDRCASLPGNRREVHAVSITALPAGNMA